MNNKIKKLSKAVTPSGPKVRTGVLVAYSGSYATVNVDGQELLLPMLDSVGSSVAVGSTVVCQVHGTSGYIIGSLNTVDRAPSGAFTGTFANPPVPKPSNLGFSYTNFSPRQVGTFGVGTLPYTVVSTTTLAANANAEHDAFWFYGTNAFSSLVGKTIQSIEIYVSPLINAEDTYPLTYTTHLSATRPSTTFSFGAAGTQTSSQSGWVSLPSGFITQLSNNLNNWGVGFYASTLNQTANQRASAPYGTLRIGWTN